MANTVADVAGSPAEQAPGARPVTMTSQQWRLAVVAELVLGAILGSLFLGTHSLFLDESVSSTLATAPWHRFANVVTHREANMALYYLLLRGWVVFGHSEIALRSLSVILAVGALWVVIMLARSLFGRRVALLAGLLLAVDPLFVQFAQDVRGYSLALLLVSASCFFFVRGIQQVDPPSRFCWTAYTVVTALAAYTNFWAALVPVGAGALARLPATGTDPVAPRADVGRRAGRAPGPARPADRVHRQRRSELGVGILGRPPVHAHPGRRSACRARSPRPGCCRRGRGGRRAGAPPAGRRGGLRPAVAAVLHPVLARRAGGRRRDAVAGRQAAARGALPDGQPPCGRAAGRAGDRPPGVPRPPRRGRGRGGAARRRRRRRRPSAPRSGTPRADRRTSVRRWPTLPTGPSRATAC